MTCLDNPDCVRSLSARLQAPLVLAMRIEAAGAGRVRVTWRRSDGDDAQVIEDEEGAVATSLYQTLSALDPSAVPCVIVLAGEVPQLRVAVDGQAVSLPQQITAGEHTAQATAPGREPWSGPLSCEGGRVLRLRVD